MKKEADPITKEEGEGDSVHVEDKIWGGLIEWHYVGRIFGDKNKLDDALVDGIYVGKMVCNP